MLKTSRVRLVVAFVATSCLLVACGSSSKKSAAPTSAPASAPATIAAPASASASAPAVSASAAAGSSAASVAPATPASSSSAPPQGKITLTEEDYWGDPAPDNPGSTAYQNAIKQFESLHPNITINRSQVPYDSMVTKVALQVTTHSISDIVLADNPMTPQLAATGGFVPLDSLGSIDESAFAAAPLSTGKYNNQLYGLSVGNNGLAVFYDKTLFAAKNLQPPATWADLTADAKALAHGKVAGVEWVGSSQEEATWNWEPFLWTAGGTLRNVNTPAGKSAIEFWANLTKDGSAPKSVVTAEDVSKDFEDGNTAMIIDGSWNIPVFDTTKGLSYGYVPIPTPTAGQAPITPLGGEVAMVSKSDAAKEQAAFEFVKWFTTTPAVITAFDQAFAYVPALTAAADSLVATDPELKVFRDEFLTGRARSQDMGTSYYPVSTVAYQQLQAALLGTVSPDTALSRMAQGIAPLLK